MTGNQLVCNNLSKHSGMEAVNGKITMIKYRGHWLLSVNMPTTQPRPGLNLHFGICVACHLLSPSFLPNPNILLRDAFKSHYFIWLSKLSSSKMF